MKQFTSNSQPRFGRDFVPSTFPAFEAETRQFGLLKFPVVPESLGSSPHRPLSEKELESFISTQIRRRMLAVVQGSCREGQQSGHRPVNNGLIDLVLRDTLQKCSAVAPRSHTPASDAFSTPVERPFFRAKAPR